MKLRLISVLYNNHKDIAPFLDSCMELIEVPTEIVFWDNAHDKETVEQYLANNKKFPFPVHVFSENKNLGFGAAVNKAISQKTDFTLDLS